MSLHPLHARLGMMFPDQQRLRLSSVHTGVRPCVPVLEGTEGILCPILRWVQQCSSWLAHRQLSVRASIGSPVAVLVADLDDSVRSVPPMFLPASEGKTTFFPLSPLDTPTARQGFSCSTTAALFVHSVECSRRQ